jgi:predicted glycosyltransferase
MDGNFRAIVHVESAAGLGHHAAISKVVAALTDHHGFDVTVTSGTFVDPHTFYPSASIRPLPPFYTKRKDQYYYWNKEGEMAPYQDFCVDQWRAQRTQALTDIYREVRPNAFITECWLFLREECDPELAAVHAISKNEDIPTLFADSMRDIFRDVITPGERKEVVCPPRAINCSHMLDALLVHADSRFVTFDSTFPHAHVIDPQKIHHTGYIADAAPCPRNMLPKDRHVVVSVGSGDGGDTMLKLALEAWDHAPPQFKDLTWHFITGPRYSAKNFIKFLGHLERKSPLIECSEQGLECNNPRFILSHYRSDLVELLADCALSISLGGYGTTMEVLQSKVPAVILPKFWFAGDQVTKHDSEQRTRSELLQQRGVIATMSLGELNNPSRLVEAMQRAVTFAANEDGFRLDFNGADMSARILRQLCERKMRACLPAPVAAI